MNFLTGHQYQDIRDAVGQLCQNFPGEYWRKLDRELAYPKAFVDALTEAGYSVSDRKSLCQSSFCKTVRHQRFE